MKMIEEEEEEEEIDKQSNNLEWKRQNERRMSSIDEYTNRAKSGNGEENVAIFTLTL